MDDTDHYRCRLVRLKQSDEPARQADAACDALASMDGIILAAPFETDSIHIIYSLDSFSFELITDLLGELGFEMDDSILLSVRNTIYCFLEDNARDNMHIDVTSFQLEEGESEVPDKPHQDSDKYWEDYH